MPSPLRLGPVVFYGFEVPDRISIGGKQKLVVHALPGGKEVIDAMGPEEAPVRWKGTFSGLHASSRVRTLERLRKAGRQLNLSWDAWRFTVIIREFEAEFENASWIPYTIELHVVPQLSLDSGDWLAAATAPLVTVEAASISALDDAIVVIGAELTAGSLSHLVAASKSLAQYVTARAYSR